MVTNKGNKIAAGSKASDAQGVSCDSVTSNDVAVGQQKISSWDITMEEFSSNLKRNNVFSPSESARFFMVQRKEGDFSKTSPFLIEKAIKSVVGEAKTVKKLRTGELLVEITSNQQALNLTKCTQLANIPVVISAHRSLNSSRGVISEPDLQYISENEILENLRDQNVIAVKRISIKRDNQQIPTKHLILTFSSPSLPHSIKAGYLKCSVRQYIPNPLRCFQCQRFGHSKTSCRGKLTCARCGTSGHESETCSAPVCCVNCKKDHPSYSRTCEKWQNEKEIQTIRTKQNISYVEARKIVDARTPKVGVSYAATVSNSMQKKSYCTSGTQTDSVTTPTKPLTTNTPATKKSQTSPSKTASVVTSAQTSHAIQSESAKTATPKSSKQTKSKTAKQNTSQSMSNRITKDIMRKVPVKSKFTAQNFLKNPKNQLSKSLPPSQNKDEVINEESVLHINTDSDLSDADCDNMSTASEKSNNFEEHI